MPEKQEGEDAVHLKQRLVVSFRVKNSNIIISIQICEHLLISCLQHLISARLEPPPVTSNMQIF